MQLSQTVEKIRRKAICDYASRKLKHSQQDPMPYTSSMHKIALTRFLDIRYTFSGKYRCRKTQTSAEHVSRTSYFVHRM